MPALTDITNIAQATKDQHPEVMKGRRATCCVTEAYRHEQGVSYRQNAEPCAVFPAHAPNLHDPVAVQCSLQQPTTPTVHAHPAPITLQRQGWYLILFSQNTASLRPRSGAKIRGFYRI